MRCGIGLAALLVVIGLQAGPAQAAFPGANGKIAFFSGTQLWTVDPDGSNVSPLIDIGSWFSDDPLFNFGGPAPAWSPDGTKIAYVRNSDIYVSNADGSNELRLTHNGRSEQPAWSPDGSKIVFSNGGWIFVMDADGGNPIQLSAAADHDPAWSPDGTRIAYAHEDVNQNTAGPAIYVMKANGTGKTKLHSPGRGWIDRAPDWSPDGTKIAFSYWRSWPDRRSRIIVMGAHGENPTPITDCTSCTGDGDFWPKWSPDGSKIAFGRQRTTLIMDVLTVNPDGGNRSVVESDVPPAANTAWQPLPAGPASITMTVSKPPTAGVPFTFQAVARDATGARMKTYFAPATWSDLGGGLAPAAPSDFVGGVSTTQVTLGAPLVSDRITVSSRGVSGQTNPFKVFGALAAISVSVQRGTISAGTPFEVRAVARDAVGNALTTYNGSATWSDLSGGLSPAAPADFVSGASVTQATISAPFAGDRITVSSGGFSGQTGPFTVF